MTPSPAANTVSCLKCGKYVATNANGSTSNLKSHLAACTGHTESSITATFDQETFTTLLIEWILENDLCFNILEHVKLRKAFHHCNSAAKLIGRTQITKRIAQIADRLSTDAHELLQAHDLDVNISHDGWTSRDMTAGYIGVMASLIDDTFTYKEVLVCILVTKGHKAGSLAISLYSALHQSGLLDKLGCVTADNAYTNLNALKILAKKLPVKTTDYFQPRLSHRISRSEQSDLERNAIGCMCHVLNLAVKDLLKSFGTIETTDFAVDDIALASTADGREHPDAISNANEQNNGTGVYVTFTQNLDLQTFSSAETELMNENTSTDDCHLSPEPDTDDQSGDSTFRQSAEVSDVVKKCRALTSYIMASPNRRGQHVLFAQTCLEKRDQLFPVKDVSTRWNSTLHMIERLLRIRPAIEAFCAIEPAAPRITPVDWKVLNFLKTLLAPFETATLLFSTRGPTLHMVLTTYYALFNTLDSLIDDTAAETQYKFGPEGLLACKRKLEKYFNNAMNNDFICIATVLRPQSALTGLISICDFAKNPERVEAVMQVIRRRLSEIAETIPDKDYCSSDTGRVMSNSVSNLRAKTDPLYLVPSAKPVRSSRSELAVYLENNNRDHEDEEDILVYWKRKSSVWPTLAKLARDILAVPGASTNVERLFSQLGNISGPKRSRLQPEQLIHQATAKVLMSQGFKFPRQI